MRTVLPLDPKEAQWALCFLLTGADCKMPYFILYFYFFKDFIYLFIHETHTHTHTHTEAETQVEGEAGSMQGAQRGT